MYCTTAARRSIASRASGAHFLPNRACYFDASSTDYEHIRAAEGRGSKGPAYYLAPPSCEKSDSNYAQWKIRARTFHYLERTSCRSSLKQLSPLRILDLGAGNGWISYRLRLRGHLPVAVDLLVNDMDGLGAAAHYESASPLSSLACRPSSTTFPSPPASFDLVIFNASFHYSENYERTLARGASLHLRRRLRRHRRHSLVPPRIERRQR